MGIEKAQNSLKTYSFRGTKPENSICHERKNECKESNGYFCYSSDSVRDRITVYDLPVTEQKLERFAK